MRPIAGKSLVSTQFMLSVVFLAALLSTTLCPTARAQESDAESGPVATTADETQIPSDSPAAQSTKAKKTQGELDFLELLVSGGVFMIPIGIFSLIGLAVAVERVISLRRARVIPEALVTGMGQLSAGQTVFDPRKAYKLCQQYPSVASTVVRAMLLKIGRPHGEIEKAVSDSLQREAERLYNNVRWLNLATVVAPMIGLLGTVWGMIICFREMTLLDVGQNRAAQLAEGIYVALVTTLGGLMVAIPAACVSHLLEGRIQSLMFQVEELVGSLMPQIERYEGRIRFTRHSESNGDAIPSSAPPPELETPSPLERVKSGR